MSPFTPSTASDVGTTVAIDGTAATGVTAARNAPDVTDTRNAPDVTDTRNVLAATGVSDVSDARGDGARGREP